MTKRNQRKRQREEENAEKGNDEKSPAKRPKTDELPVKDQPAKSSETLSAQPVVEKQEEEKSISKENSSVDHVDEVKMEHVTDDDEDPEEDPEEYEPMEDASPQHDSSTENIEVQGKNNVNDVPANEKDEVIVKEENDMNAEETKAKPEADTCEKKEEKVDTGKKETPRAKEVVDKELLQVYSWTRSCNSCFILIVEHFVFSAYQ